MNTININSFIPVHSPHEKFINSFVSINIIFFSFICCCQRFWGLIYRGKLQVPPGRAISQIFKGNFYWAKEGLKVRVVNLWGHADIIRTTIKNGHQLLRKKRLHPQRKSWLRRWLLLFFKVSFALLFFLSRLSIAWRRHVSTYLHSFSGIDLGLRNYVSSEGNAT